MLGVARRATRQVSMHTLLVSYLRVEVHASRGGVKRSSGQAVKRSTSGEAVRGDAVKRHLPVGEGIERHAPMLLLHRPHPAPAVSFCPTHTHTHPPPPTPLIIFRFGTWVYDNWAYGSGRMKVGVF